MSFMLPTASKINERPLLQPLIVGDLTLKNRILMAPLTRGRATGSDGRTPNAMMAKYYAQRASAGLILSEATAVHPMGVGYANTPGIWSSEHVTAWKIITEAVHQNGGKIFLQLWHVGRVSHPQFLGGELPIAPSALAPAGHVSLVKPKTPYVIPRALQTYEIASIVESYRKGAENARIAGFDGVELHGANGYLLDQFLQDSANKRTDQYGGSIENRARLMMEVTDAAISVWGAARVGMHLAPRSDTASMGDANPETTFSYVAEQLGRRKIAFICAREYIGDNSLGPKLKRIFKGVYIGNEKFTFENAEAELKKGNIDAVAFGRDFIANPDLVRRYELKRTLNQWTAENFYSGGQLGYTDYPTLNE